MFTGAISFAELVAPAFNISGERADIDIIADSVCSGGKYAYNSWGPEAKRKQGVSIYLEMTSNAWTNAWFSFKAAKDGDVNLNLYGAYQIVGGSNRRINVLFDDVEAEGSAVKNGSFEDARNNIPASWSPYARDGTLAGGPRYLAKRGINGSSCIMTWHNGTIAQYIKCKKDEAVTIRLKCKLAGADDEAAFVPGADVKPDNSKYKDIPDTFADLSSTANMGFADDRAGDGVGGWSDQGLENDFSGFDVKRTDFGGMQFRIIDPQNNNGKAVMTFRSPSASAVALTKAHIDLTSRAPAHFLYLLHSSAWNQEKKGSIIGTVTATLADGKSVRLDIQAMTDVADWWKPVRLPNAVPVVKKTGASATVGIYLSKFAISDALADIVALDFETTEKAIWIVVGATLSPRDITLPEELRLVFKEDERWKKIDMPSVQVLPGSALDLSGLSDNKPAGHLGKVIIAGNGRFAFEKQPDKEIRFFAYQALMNHLFERPVTALGSGSEEQRRQKIELYVSLMKRQGYNMFRVQAIDLYLMGGSKEDCVFNPHALDNFEYFIFCLKKAGIYIYLDASSFGSFSKRTWDELSKWDPRQRIYFEEPVRAVWETGVRNLLSHVNPYTKTMLAEDPILAVVTFFNEQDIGVSVQSFHSPDLLPLAEARWREFLKQKYANMQSLERSWNTGMKRINPGCTFDTIPYFDKGSPWEIGPRGNDVGLFLADIESGLLAWYEKTIRTMGYTGLTTQYDVIKLFRNHAVRNKESVISMHGYHNHPSSFSEIGSVIGQNGAVETFAGYWRDQVTARFLNRPLCVTEYGTPYWGKFRHQEGLLYPAYSSLQGLSAITVHANAVILNPNQPLQDFAVGRDPIGRASQVLAAFLYRRMDVASSTHAVALSINRDYINANCNRAVNGEQSKVALLCGFGLQFDDELTPGLPAYTKADLTLMPGEGAEMAASTWAANIVDSGDGKNMDKIIARMKASGILDAENRTSAADRIFQSDTREITLDAKQKRMTVITPRTEGAILEANGSLILGKLRVKTTCAASIAAVSLDGADLSESARVLIIYSTDAVNTGHETSDDRTVLYSLGVLPILIETGIMRIALENRNAATMKCWALAMNGQRREEIVPVSTASGRIELIIDTAALKTGPALFFELTK